MKITISTLCEIRPLTAMHFTGIMIDSTRQSCAQRTDIDSVKFLTNTQETNGTLEQITDARHSTHDVRGWPVRILCAAVV